MSNVPSELRDDIPTFDDQPSSRGHGPIDWTGLTSVRTAKSALEIGTIVGLALARVHVIAVRVGVALHGLVCPRDVEEDVAIGNEAIRMKEVDESAVEIALGEVGEPQIEVQIGLVRRAVGERGAGGQERGDERGQQQGDGDSADDEAHRLRLWRISRLGRCGHGRIL